MSTEKSTEQILQELRDFQNKPLSEETLNGWNVLCHMAEEARRSQKGENDFLYRMDVDAYQEKGTCGGADDYIAQYDAECGTNFSTYQLEDLAKRDTLMRGENNVKELVISKVKHCPAPYQSWYVHNETQADEYSILGVASVAAKNPEHYILANRNNHFIAGTDTFEEAVKLAVEYGMAASEVVMNVQITTPSMSQEELQQLKELLNKARTLLDSTEANVFVLNNEDDCYLGRMSRRRSVSHNFKSRG